MRYQTVINIVDVLRNRLLRHDDNFQRTVQATASWNGRRLGDRPTVSVVHDNAFRCLGRGYNDSMLTRRQSMPDFQQPTRRDEVGEMDFAEINTTV